MDLRAALSAALERAGTDPVVIEEPGVRLDIATGRPGAICFSLMEKLDGGFWITLAEGFSLGDHLVYDKRTVPEPVIERRIMSLLERAGAQPHDAGHASVS